MKICIKNMVCERCKIAVKREMEKLGISYAAVNLGEIEITEDPTKDQLVMLDLNLREWGLEIIECKLLFLTEQVKIAIIDKIYNNDGNVTVSFSDFLSKKLKHEYFYLNRIFLNSEGLTIHQYVIAQKIERVKELLMYGELNLSQIAYKLNYSSVAHLSNQFKKITGHTPSTFLQSKKNPRCPVDQVGNIYKRRKSRV